MLILPLILLILTHICPYLLVMSGESLRNLRSKALASEPPLLCSRSTSFAFSNLDQSSSGPTLHIMSNSRINSRVDRDQADDSTTASLAAMTLGDSDVSPNETRAESLGVQHVCSNCAGRQNIVLRCARVSFVSRFCFESQPQHFCQYFSVRLPTTATGRYVESHIDTSG